jgi:hypothetical protein
LTHRQRYEEWSEVEDNKVLRGYRGCVILRPENLGDLDFWTHS